MKELQKQVAELMEKGYIRESLSLCAIPVLLVPKKDSSWRIGAQLFSKIDLKSGYHKICMREGDEWKTAFKTKYGLYECKSLEDHFQHLRTVLEVLRKEVKEINECRVQQVLAKEFSLVDKLLQKTFEVECDASRIGIKVVLMQDGRPVAYFSEKLNGATLNYLTYDKEMYALIRALETWQHYLWQKEFVIHTDHEALKHLKGQTKLNKRHAKWVKYLESFPYVIKYKKGKKYCYRRIITKDLSYYHLRSRHKIFKSFLEDIVEQVRHQIAIFDDVPPPNGWPNGEEFEAVGRECLPHVEFAYNRTIHSTTKHSPFEVVYGFNPITPLDLVPMASNQLVHVDGKKKANFVKQLHKNVKDNIKRRTKQYVRGANKGADGPFQVLEWINDNVYKLDLPSEYGVSASFNVADLSPFDVGPITRAGAKRFQKVLSSYIALVGDANLAASCYKSVRQHRAWPKLEGLKCKMKFDFSSTSLA
ncbi:hypothetical protein CXB51_003299 [Gossypium anomalum]|uniref:Reverse transcriptase RNase H-like domain-containing protein n=1 Tax=Gossypium anomalum TaxID=47600 RepID=A0A8J6D7B6_9ROSI|nr:hypothetical protein CXB51_003299 [Gossypium anomalum]